MSGDGAATTGGARVDVILVNWNGWRHTLECLESLTRLLAPPPRVIVVDNGSTDASLAAIQAWCEGSLTADRSAPVWRRLPAERRLTPRLIGRDEARRGPTADADVLPILPIPLADNRGFAAGVNAGLAIGLADGADLFWILNNDTVAAPNALAALTARFRIDPALGLCAGALHFYDDPDRIQGYAGAFDPKTTRAWHIGMNARAPMSQAAIEAQMAYPIGANMMASRAFVERTGLLEERYFLFFEELDWAARGGRAALGACPEAVVFHKEGAAIGTTSARLKSPLSLHYLAFSRLRFIALHHPDRLGAAYRWILRDLADHVIHGEFAAARVLWNAMQAFRNGDSGAFPPK